MTVIALLLTLVAIFAFQAENITTRAFHVVLIAIPILIQVYFNSGLAYGLMKLFRVPYGVAAPGALIGASNFFELAVATAIALYGPGSGAALATVVGVLVEVPVMLSVCRFCVATRGWFEPAAAANVLGPASSPEARSHPWLFASSRCSGRAAPADTRPTASSATSSTRRSSTASSRRASRWTG